MYGLLAFPKNTPGSREWRERGATDGTDGEKQHGSGCLQTQSQWSQAKCASAFRNRKISRMPPDVQLQTSSAGAHKYAVQSILDLFSYFVLVCRDADSKLFGGRLRNSN